MPKRELTYAASTVAQRRAWRKLLTRAAICASRGNRAGMLRLQAAALQALTEATK